MPMSEYWTSPEHQLSTHHHNSVIIECNSSWCDNEKVLICVRTEHSLNVCECAWTPLSQYWTCPEHLWVHVNAFKSVLNTPWMLVSAHECQWVSGNIPWIPIECTWMPMSEWDYPLQDRQVCHVEDFWAINGRQLTTTDDNWRLLHYLNNVTTKVTT
jgi:hypothetical protein